MKILNACGENCVLAAPLATKDELNLQTLIVCNHVQTNTLPNSLINSVNTPGSLSIRHQFPALSAIFFNDYEYFAISGSVHHPW